MRSTAVIICDSMGFAGAKECAEFIKKHGHTPIALVRDDIKVPEGVFEVHRIESYSELDIRTAFLEISEFFYVVGITYSVGQFTRDGLISSSLAKIAKDLGLKFASARSLEWSTNKFHCRKVLWEKGVERVPHFVMSKDNVPFLDPSLKWVAKPMIGGSSTFIRKVSNPLQPEEVLNEFLERKDSFLYKELVLGAAHTIKHFNGVGFSYNPHEELLVEEYLEGREYSVEIVVADGKVVPLYVHDKIDVNERGYSVFENVLVTPPMSFSQSELDAIHAHALNVIVALELDNTRVHLECRYSTKYGPCTLEVNARGAFGIRKSFIELMGIHPELLGYQLSVGTCDVDDLEERSKKLWSVDQRNYFTLQFFFSEKSGRVKSVCGEKEIQDLAQVLSFENSAVVGNQVGGNNEETFLGNLWGKVTNREDALSLYAKVKKLYQLEVEAAC
jgi:hypothetical protein